MRLLSHSPLKEVERLMKLSSVRAQKELDIRKDGKCVICGEKIGFQSYEVSVTKPFTVRGVSIKKKEVYAHTKCLVRK